MKGKDEEETVPLLLPESPTAAWRPPSPILSPRRSGSRLLRFAIAFVTLAFVVAVFARTAASVTPSRKGQSLQGFTAERANRVLPPDLRASQWWPRASLTRDKVLHHPILNVASPLCPMDATRQARYAPLASPESRNISTAPTGLRYLIAANLYNSQHVLPTLIHTLTTVIDLLGPSRFHVSIVENGSEDDTPAQLYLFAALLRTLNVDFTIVSKDEAGGYKEGERIAVLAKLRNAAMRPLLDGTAKADRVLWLNDVFMCPADLLELLLQHETQQADMTCGMDWKSLRIPEFKETPYGYPHLVYDQWVDRTMQGLPFYNISSETGVWRLPSPPLLDSRAQNRYDSNDPVQVFSCWNGVAVLDAAAFSSPSSASSSELPLSFRTDDEGQDSQSECYLLCTDLWRAKHVAESRGARIQMVPRTAVAYRLGDYEHARQDRTPFTGSTLLSERIAWVDEPPARIASYPYAKWDRLQWIAPY